MLFGIFPSTSRMPKFWHTCVMTYGDFVYIYIYIIFPINKCTKEKYIKNFMTPFYILWIAFSCLKAAEPLGGDNLPFHAKSPGISVTHLNNFG